MMLHLRAVLQPFCRHIADEHAFIYHHVRRRNCTKNTSNRPVGPARTTTDLIMERNFRIRKRKLKRKPREGPLSRSLELRVICSGARGLSNSVVLISDTEMYLFNCGELTHRMLVDNGIEGSIKNLFFTYNSWRNTGGLMGLLMSKIRTVHREESTKLHGPDHVGSTLKLVKFFEADATSLAQTEFVGLTDGRFEDQQISIDYVQLYPEATTNQPGTDVSPQHLDGTDEPSKKIAVAYIIMPKSRPYRKLDIDKLMALDIDSGPWVGDLVNGKPVSLDNGLVITPEDVLEDKFSPRPIIILECPADSYLNSLQHSEQLSMLSRTGVSSPELIVHMSSSDVVADHRYRDFIDSFASTTQHLILNESSPGPVLQEASHFVSILNQIHPGLFPLLETHTQNCGRESLGSTHITQAVSGLCYKLKPAKGFQQPPVPPIDARPSLQKDKQLHHQLSALHNTINKMTADQVTGNIQRVMYPEIVFLGTGSTLPLGTRSSSGILVQMQKDEYLLLDCGEGTLSQLYQLYGSHVPHILENLKAVFISHLHYDHHGGLFSVIESHQKLRQRSGCAVNELTILAPQMLQRWLRKYSQHLEDVHIRLVPHHFMYECFSTNMNNTMQTEVNKHLSAKQYIPVPVNHVSNSYGLVLQHEEGWKLVYSGDTMPCPLLTDIGQGCDILIHEATFPDGSEKLAASKKHSTSRQAISVGHKMSAQFTILTHFSHHVTGSIPVFTEDFTDNVGFAFDFLTVSPRTWQHIPPLKPVLKYLFWDEMREQRLKHRNKFSSFDCGLLEARTDRMNFRNTDILRSGKESKRGTQNLIDKLINISQTRKLN